MAIRKMTKAEKSWIMYDVGTSFPLVGSRRTALRISSGRDYTV